MKLLLRSRHANGSVHSNQVWLTRGPAIFVHDSLTRIFTVNWGRAGLYLNVLVKQAGNDPARTSRVAGRERFVPDTMVAPQIVTARRNRTRGRVLSQQFSKTTPALESTSPYCPGKRPRYTSGWSGAERQSRRPLFLCYDYPTANWGRDDSLMGPDAKGASIAVSCTAKGFVAAVNLSSRLPLDLLPRNPSILLTTLLGRNLFDSHF